MDQEHSRARRTTISPRIGFKTLAVVVVGGLLALTIPATAQAAGPVSQGEGRLLTASLLGSALDPLVALNGAVASDPGGPATSDVPLDATALGLITAQANTTNLFGTGGIIQLGAVGQYAAANPDGSSVAFSGAVSEAGSLVGVGTTVTPSNIGTPAPGDSATISVGTAQLVGGANLVQLDVNVGALAASAKETAAGVQSGSYTLASLDVAVGGTVVGTAANGVNVLLDPVVAAVNGVLGAGTVVNPLAGGQVEVSLADLYAAATAAGVDVNNLPEGTNLLTYLPAAVTAKITSIVTTLLATLQTDVSTNALVAIAVGPLLGLAQVAVPPILTGLTATLNGPLGAAVDAVLQLDVNNKTTSPALAFTQNALTVGVGPAGAIATVGLANATVGPNAGAVVPPAAAITGMVPNTGPVTGNTTVTITGSGFNGTTNVTFDLLPAKSFIVVNDTTITAVSPPHAVGPVNVVVDNPAGNSPDTAASVFTYTPLVIDPNSGPTTGTTVVSIVGSCFIGATGVTFDGIAGTAFRVVDDTHILVTTPAHIAGAVNVVVQGSLVCGGSTTVVDGFTYVAPGGPTAISLTPPSGPASGGTTVTITGTNLTGATGVTFDGIPGTGFTVVNGTTITVVSPPHAVGGVNVVVQTPLGPSGALAFTYLPTTVIGADPGTGPEEGGTAVTITGTCFTGATAVLFGNTAATSFVVVNDTTITATSPAGVGTVDVTVIGSLLCGNGTIPAAFQYIAGGLAFTGAVVIPSLITAFLLLLTGLGVFLARRRRNRMTA